MEEGERISWDTVHGEASGIVESEAPLGWYVRLDNGKYVIVNK